jgi:hypothetical protein
MIQSTESVEKQFFRLERFFEHMLDRSWESDDYPLSDAVIPLSTRRMSNFKGTRTFVIRVRVPEFSGMSRRIGNVYHVLLEIEWSRLRQC